MKHKYDFFSENESSTMPLDRHPQYLDMFRVEVSDDCNYGIFHLSGYGYLPVWWGGWRTGHRWTKTLYDYYFSDIGLARLYAKEQSKIVQFKDRRFDRKRDAIPIMMGVGIGIMLSGIIKLALRYLV